MQMSIAEILVISIGLSIDVFVAGGYLGGGFFEDPCKEFGRA